MWPSFLSYQLTLKCLERLWNFRIVCFKWPKSLSPSGTRCEVTFFGLQDCPNTTVQLGRAVEPCFWSPEIQLKLNGSCMVIFGPEIHVWCVTSPKLRRMHRRHKATFSERGPPHLAQPKHGNHQATSPRNWTTSNPNSFWVQATDTIIERNIIWNKGNTNQYQSSGNDSDLDRSW